MPEKHPKIEEASILRVLREHFGLPGFRNGQLEAVSATLAGEDSVVILPTGGGKSVCFQLPCHVHEFGFTVVICPLIALAKDQVDKCDERGIYAERWNCEVLEARKASIAKDIASDQPSLRLLYTTPESFRQPSLLESLKEACANGKLVSFAVDEAHTVSEWGHDFRPAYLELSFIKQEFPSVPVTALTASCTCKVQADIISVLRLRSPKIIKGSFNRPNLAYQVRHKELIGDGSDAAALEDLVRFIQERPDQCGIIYARLRTTCDWLASALAALDVEVGCYHAGKATDARARVQRDWSSGGLNVVVATIAFGMGIDRADVRWVVHWNAPSSMEGFYQESGRAGRDGLPSLAIMYASRSDLEANHKMERGTRTGAVAEVAGYVQGAGCRRKHILKFFGEDRGPCERSTDEPCDFCTDPRAVQGALLRLEQRESEHGSKAAVVRARMMGICVAPVGSDGDSAEGDGHNGEGAGGSKPCGAGVAWSRATTYGTSAPTISRTASRIGSESLKSQPQPADNAADVMVHNSSGIGPAVDGLGGVQGSSALLPRRPPAIKRALPARSIAIGTALPVASGGIAACMDANDSYAASPSTHGHVPPFHECPGAATLAPLSEERAAPPSCVSGMPLPSHTRQPQLKRLKPSVQLPFKAPSRTGPPPSGCSAAAAAGKAQERLSLEELVGKLPTAQAVEQQAMSVKPSSHVPHGVIAAGWAAGAEEGSCTATVPVKGSGVPTEASAPLALKRRLPFKPPMRIIPG